MSAQDEIIKSANEWASVGRQRVLEAKAAIELGNFGTAGRLSELADRCFDKEKQLRQMAQPAPPPSQ